MRFEAKEKTRLDAARAFLGPPEPPTPIGIVDSPYEASFAPGLCYATSKTKPYPPRRTCRVPAQRPADSLRLPREECGEGSREDTAPDLYRCPRCTRRWRRQTTLFTLLSIILRSRNDIVVTLYAYRHHLIVITIQQFNPTVAIVFSV